MSATILEARAVITADDKTGAAFSAIEKKMAHLAKASAGTGRSDVMASRPASPAGSDSVLPEAMLSTKGSMSLNPTIPASA